MKQAEESINDRIEMLVIQLSDGNKSAFCRSLGIPEGSLGNIIGGMTRRSRPNIDLLVKIIERHNVDPMWLLTGKESATKRISTQGDYSPASMSGDISMDVGDAVLTERVKALEAIIAEKDERIAVLKEIITELRAR